MDLDAFDAILFDKDGTLFDFQATWAPWAKELIERLAQGDAHLIAPISQALGFDFDAVAFEQNSMSISSTPAEQVAVLQPLLPHMDAQTLLSHFEIEADGMPAVPVGGLASVLQILQAQGKRLGVVTNDFEDAARIQLQQVNVLDMFETIVGFDSGFGGKPAPEGCLAAAKALGVPPERTIMVGDSLHDLHAGRAAGMLTVGVLTGPATREDLEAHADHILHDITDFKGFVM